MRKVWKPMIVLQVYLVSFNFFVRVMRAIFVLLRVLVLANGNHPNFPTVTSAVRAWCPDLGDHVSSVLHSTPSTR